MKKVLFGIMAFSMAAFAANPGSATEASVPVEVRAEVVAADNALVITDEVGNVLADGIILDHGTRAQGDTNHTVSKTFKVKRVNGNPSNAIAQGTDSILTVTLEDMDNSTTRQVNLGRSGGGAVDPKDKLVSALTLDGGNETDVSGKHGYKADMGTTATEHTGAISSTITVAANQNPGTYNSKIDPFTSGNNRTATLKVVLAAK